MFPLVSNTRIIPDNRFSESNSEYQTIAEWLSPLNFLQKQKDVYSPDFSDTDQWFLTHKTFRNWRKRRFQFLCCHGMAGSGKTVLTSIVFEHLRNHLSSLGQKVAVACIYCEYKQTDLQTSKNLVASLWPQLTANDGEKSLTQFVKDLHSDHTRKRTLPDIDEVRLVVESALKLFESVYILVDALDECSEAHENRTIFTDQLKILGQLREPKVEILVTSRFPDSVFEGAREIPIRARESDITQMVSRRISRPNFIHSKSMSELLQADAELRDTIVRSVVEKADGMFLHARLYVDSLVTKKSRRRLAEALASPAQDLDQLYEDAWARINDQPIDASDLAQQTMLWLCLAKRQLTVLELRHALAIQPQDKNFDPEGLSSLQDILETCQGLAAVDSQSNVVRLVHSTAHNFIEDRVRRNVTNASTIMTELCLTYLSFDNFEKGPCDYVSFRATAVPLGPRENQRIAKQRFLPTRLTEYPLLEYAANHWGHHAQGEPETVCQKNILDFLASPKKLASSVQVQVRSRDCNLSPLHMTVLLNLKKITLELLKNLPRADIEVRDYDGRTALHIAVSAGLLEIVLALLKAGANPQIPPGIVHRAIIEGHDDIVCCLLEFEYEMFATPELLRCAALMETMSVMQMFLMRISDKKAKIATANQILRHAALESKIGSMQFAMSEGAETDFIDDKGHTVLLDTVRHGQIEAVRYLLNMGADAFVRSPKGKSLVQIAAKSQKVFKNRLGMISDWGCSQDVESSPQLKDTATQLFLKSMTEWFKPENRLEELPDCADFIETLHEDSSHVKIIDMLLDQGADVTERDSGGESLLHMSISSVARVRAVLRRSDQLHVDGIDNDGRTALHFAAAARRPAIMKILLQGGADMKTKDHRDASTLHFTVGDPECVSIALENGCEVNVFDKDCRTPYHYAHLIEESSVEVIKLLEANGAKIGAVDIQRKAAKEYLWDRYGSYGREENTYWIDSMWLRRYSLDKIRIRAALYSSHIRAPQAAQRFSDQIDEMWEKEKTWAVVEDSSEEDFDPE